MTMKMRWFLSTLGVAAWLTTVANTNAQTSGGGSSGGSSGGMSSSSLGVVGSNSSGGSLSGAGSSSSSSPFSGVSGGGGSSGGTSGSTVSSTNFLSPTFSNPLYEGRPNQTITSSASTSSSGTAASASQPGGFGQSSFGSATSTSSKSTGGASNSSISAAASTTSTTRMHYATVVSFKTQPIVASRLQADLRTTLNSSSFIEKPSSINIAVDGQTVVLTGRVKDNDERRQAEALIRLTPGVRMIENRLETPEVPQLITSIR